MNRMLLPLVFLLAIFACKKADERGQTELVTFPLRGEVVRIDRQRMRLTVAHDAIPKYMDAMTMPFRVKDSTLLDGLNVGDSITATLAVSRTESWLERIAAIGRGAPHTMTPDEVARERLFQPGETLPEVAFVDQNGTPFRLSSLRGKAVALTFIYTLCPLPDFCVRMSDHFSQVERALKRFPNLADRWHLVSVSFDPDRDTPPVLKGYAARFSADLTDWSFVTAPRKELDPLLEGSGLFAQNGEGGLIEHNLRTILIDANGKITKIITGNEWRPEEVTAELRKLGE